MGLCLFFLMVLTIGVIILDLADRRMLLDFSRHKLCIVAGAILRRSNELLRWVNGLLVGTRLLRLYHSRCARWQARSTRWLIVELLSTKIRVPSSFRILHRLNVLLLIGCILLLLCVLLRNNWSETILVARCDLTHLSSLSRHTLFPSLTYQTLKQFIVFTRDGLQTTCKQGRHLIGCKS